MRNYLLLIGSIFICQFSLAQSNNIAEYIKAVDFVTCLCMNEALTDSQEEFDCTILPINKDAITDSRTKDLYNEIQNLKGINRPEDYSKFLSEDIFNNEKKFNKIYSFASKRKEDKISNIKSQIKDYIKNSSLNKSDIVEPESSDYISNGTVVQDNTADIEPYSQNIEKNNSETSSFNLWTGILLGLIILVAILSTIIYFSLKREMQDLKSKIGFWNKMQNSPIKESTQNFQKSGDNSKIEKLECRIKTLEQSLLNQKSIATTYNEEKSPEVILEVPKEKRQPTVVFYMATPNKEDGSFDISSQTENFKPTQSLYKFTVDNSNSSKAKFEFFSDDAGIRDCVDSPQTYIDPVCEPQNARNPTIKKIVTVSSGTAEKNNDKWEVLTKAKIKYE